jgi:biopolymer transport protein TolQ
MSSFDWNLRVYWEDTDAGGVVFYANYLKFFERARTEWLRALGVDQQALADTTGAIFVVRSTAVDYRAPARLDDLVQIRSRMERVGPASVQFAQEGWRGDVLLASGTIRVGCVDRLTFRPTPISRTRNHQSCRMNPVEVTQDLSIVSLVLHASLLVQFVMGLLLVMSLFSWTYIFRKAFALRAARSQTETFERDFWAGGDLQALYQSAANNRHKTGALERIFEAGMREYLKTREQQRGGGDPSAILDAARRAMRAAYQREMDSLESHLPFLASVGSVSPYIGLFGTVWGIMNAFRGLSNVQQATLSAVAPGIAEALVATAIGLFAAIPAVIAYNRYATELDRLANRFESFMEEFSNILQRQTR